MARGARPRGAGHGGWARRTRPRGLPSRHLHGRHEDARRVPPPRHFPARSTRVGGEAGNIPRIRPLRVLDRPRLVLPEHESAATHPRAGRHDPPMAAVPYWGVDMAGNPRAVGPRARPLARPTGHGPRPRPPASGSAAGTTPGPRPAATTPSLGRLHGPRRTAARPRAVRTGPGRRGPLAYHHSRRALEDRDRAG